MNVCMCPTSGIFRGAFGIEIKRYDRPLGTSFKLNFQQCYTAVQQHNHSSFIWGGIIEDSLFFFSIAFPKMHFAVASVCYPEKGKEYIIIKTLRPSQLSYIHNSERGVFQSYFSS